MTRPRRFPLLAMIGPGLLVAATGVGAGDLATGALVGNRLGTAILWAVLLGAFLKYVLSEGLTRWQLVTGETILEGACRRFGRPMQFGFLLYLLVWSFGVGAALMSACGVAAHALCPLAGPLGWVGADGDPAVVDKIVYGLLHSAIAVVLILVGGYKLFEKVMSVCIAAMFVTVITTAIAIGPNWGDVLRGMVVPTIPDVAASEVADGEADARSDADAKPRPMSERSGLTWTIALMGGVGGTLTIVCYGYWIREKGRTSIDDLALSRIDLATGYGMTAVFGLAMVIVGSVAPIDGKGAKLVVGLGDHIRENLGAIGPWLSWAFLIGAWGAFFSSLLGVWQCVPYLFADFYSLAFGDEETEQRTLDRAVDTSSWTYRGYLFALATIPSAGLFVNFTVVQKWNAVIGAMVIPLLAVALLILNGRTKHIGATHRNSVTCTVVLTTSVVFFAIATGLMILERLAS